MTTIKNTNESSIILAAEILKEGNLVSFPTETVYGLGGDATNNLSIAKIFETKNRPEFNPLIIHFSSFDQVEENCEINDDIKKLNDLFWPGPMTVILKKKKESKISELASASLDTVGVRIPSNTTALKLIKSFGKPIAAPSANTSSSLSPTEADHVFEYFKNDKNLSIILDGGSTKIGLESTIINITNGEIHILRHGGISAEELKEKFPQKIINIEQKTNEKIIAPGMLSKHYSPVVPLRINAKKAEKNELLIGFGPNYNAPNLSFEGNLVEAASNLFSFLAKYQKKYSKIAIAPIPNKGIGRAINDRIKRATSKNQAVGNS